MKYALLIPRLTTLNPYLDPDAEEPQGLEYIASALMRNGYVADIFIPRPDEDSEEFMRRVLASSPDVIGMSLYTWHVPSALTIARRAKQLRPKTLVIAGGPHPSGAPELATSDDIDFCVLGEGDETIVELAKALCLGCDSFSHIAGISYVNSEGRLVVTAPRRRIEDLGFEPVHTRDWVTQRGYSVYSPPCSEMNCASVLFSRGCPCDCTFCSSSRMWSRKIRYRPVGTVINEIKRLKIDHGINYVFFEDLFFTADQDRVTELCNAMIDERLELKWWCETSPRSVSERLLGLMKKAGCNKIGWGIEATDDRTLARIGKGSQSNEGGKATTRHALALAAETGILNLGYVMVGFPWDTPESIAGLAKRLEDYEIHQLRLAIATPFPGSPWFDTFNESELDPDLSRYDTNHLVYKHVALTPDQVQELRHKVFCDYYSSSIYRKRVARINKQFPEYVRGFDEFLSVVDASIGSGGSRTKRSKRLQCVAPR